MIIIKTIIPTMIPNINHKFVFDSFYGVGGVCDFSSSISCCVIHLPLLHFLSLGHVPHVFSPVTHSLVSTLLANSKLRTASGHIVFLPTVVHGVILATSLLNENNLVCSAHHKLASIEN